MRILSLILALGLLSSAPEAAAVIIGASASAGAVPAIAGTGLAGSYYKFGVPITSMGQAVQLMSAAGGPTATFTTAAVCYPNCNISTVVDSATTLSGLLGGNAADLTYTVPPSQIPATIDHSAMTLTGYVAIGQAGTYNFNLGSDDGAQLTIANQVVIAGNALHSFMIDSGSATFAAAGLYAITIQYYENSGYTGLEFWGSDSAGNCAFGRCNNTFASNPFYLTVPGANAVPEPGTATTVLVGLAALAWIRRRTCRAI